MTSRALWPLVVLVALLARAPESASAGVRSAAVARLDATDIHATFDIDGAHVSVGAVVRAVSIGRHDVRPLDARAPTRVGDEIRSERGRGVTEWWRSLARGLEHGVDLATRPPGEGELRIEIAVRGLVPSALDGDTIALCSRDGSRLAEYGHLRVVDADARTLRSRMFTRDGSIVLAIDDRDARYPVIVDPTLEANLEATLSASDRTTGDTFGPVALASDGSRAIVGASSHVTSGFMSAGAAYVFVRTGTSWAQEAELVAPTPASNGSFGWSVAITSDGSRVIVGAIGGIGAAHVFARSGSSWSLEATISPMVGGDFGSAVALASDGSRAIIGAEYVGAAYVFVRTGSSWMIEGSPLVGAGTVGGVSGDRFGHTVALASDASRALVGGYAHATSGRGNAGAAYVFSRAVTTWMQEAELDAPGAPAGAFFGSGVALASDASRAVIGAQGASPGTGSAYTFVRAGTTWSYETTLVASDAMAGSLFGAVVAVDATASHALVGAQRSSANAGAAYLFTRSGTSWAQDVELAGPVPGGWFGADVALAGDASRALVGSPLESSSTGAARVYTLTPTVANGASCTRNSSCISGFCVDGVCCGAACGGGFTGPPGGQCQACAMRFTGVADGTCAPLDAAHAALVTCRASSAPCDAAEVCVAGSAVCPSDGAQPASHVCSMPAGPTCQTPTHCDGVSAACPAPQPLASGTVCSAPTGSCDLAAVCDGSSTTCGANPFVAAGTLCRAAAGPCDTNSVCTGSSAACPATSPAAAGTMCRAASGPCDIAATCDGTTRTCPPNLVRPAGTVCLPADPTSACSADAICDGVGSTCLPRFASAATLCHASMGACDSTVTCTGTSATCPSSFMHGVVCRPAAGACDIAESCTGASATCPPDAVEGSGTVCRASVAGCDPAESCDGAATTCPPDVSACTTMPDGGGHDAGTDAAADAAAPHDGSASTSDAASSATDAATVPPPSTGGCGCSTGRRADHATVVGLAWIALALHGRSRRRRHRRSGRA